MLITRKEILKFMSPEQYADFIDWIVKTLKENEDYEYKEEPLFILVGW